MTMNVGSYRAPIPIGGPYTPLNLVVPVPGQEMPVELLPDYLCFVCNGSGDPVAISQPQGTVNHGECAIVDTRGRADGRVDAASPAGPAAAVELDMSRGPLVGPGTGRLSDAVVVYLSPAFCEEFVSFLGLRTDTLSLIDHAPFPMEPRLRDSVRTIGNQIGNGSPPKPSTGAALEIIDEAAIDVVITVLRYVRLRQDVLSAFASKRSSTVDAIVLSLLRGRNVLEKSFKSAGAIDRASRRAGMSRYHFQRVFRQTFNCPPGQYRKRCRLEAARRLIEYRRFRVTDAAAEVGYGSLSSFIHAFREYHGVSPGSLANGNARDN